MGSFTTEILIGESRQRVWEVLADLGAIHKWNPGVSHSYATSAAGGGEGATRHCDLADRGYLKERAFDWREGEGFKIDVYETDLPLKRNVVEFSLRSDGDGTVVSVTPDYELKYGPIGSLIDRLFAGRRMRKGMDDLLDGLKRYAETGGPVGDRDTAASLAHA